MPTGHLTRGGIALAEAVRELYSQGQTDYSLEPIVLVDVQGNPAGCIQDGTRSSFAAGAANAKSS